MKRLWITGILTFLVTSTGFAQTNSYPIATWTENEIVPATGRSNPFQLSSQEFTQAKYNGQLHAQFYPVTVTGSLPPYAPLKNSLDAPSGDNFLKNWAEKFFKDLSGIHSSNDFFKWLGLHEYPKVEDTGIYQVALPPEGRPDHLMGLGFINRGNATGFTFSCAACHSGNLFGKTVLGMTNRFPHANELFYRAQQALAVMGPETFQATTHATDAEKELFAATRNNLKAVGGARPIVVGLDTSLAQLALSLSKRNADAYATKNPYFESFPRQNWLASNPADSKPAVWWNLKYKNRWLSDGSLVSGNPIYTNFLWNEVGRGSDLQQLEQWLNQNQNIIRDLTTAVFSSEAPKWSDFFAEGSIDLNKAKAGEALFNDTCFRCHGTYDKGWDAADTSQMSWKDLIATTKVNYFAQTPVKDVGTDSQRWMGMQAIVPVNELSISKKTNTVIKPQRGYVPPPLVGIWARWPYFHNNSAPNLCAVLTKASDRPKLFYMGEATDAKTDFDSKCVGYPTGDQAPSAWKTKEFLYDTSKIGMTNTGHDEGIFLDNGKEIFTPEEKQQIIEFLKTL